MSDIYNSWKAKGKKVSKKSSFMIGMVYTAYYQTQQIIGILESLEDNQAHIRTKENDLFLVDKSTLKIVLNN